MEFVGYGLKYLSGLISRWVGDVVRHAYQFGAWFSADSAGCSLGRFSHWWRSVWVSVYGEGGVHTSVVLVQCWVAAFTVFAGLVLAVFFITISHCAWRRVISWSLVTKKQSKENAFTTLKIKCPQRAVLIHGCPKSTVLARAPDV